MTRVERDNGRAPYGKFARYYDFIYDRLVDYRGDVAFLRAAFRRFMEEPPRELLDLGCGTGTHALLLARRGYRVTGLDRSPSQLAIARRKARAAGARVRFIRGDMAAFDLGATFDAAICMFGGFGYLVRGSEVLGCFRSVRRHLRPRGLFVFEFWQSSATRPAPHRSFLQRRGPDYEVIRLAEARFDPRTRRLPIDFWFFVLRGDRVLDRFHESHPMRTFTLPEIRRLLARGGFDLVGGYGATNLEKGFRPPRRDDFRVMVVARRKPPTNA